MKKIQLYRNISQILFLVLLIAGIYMDLRYVLIAFLPASLLFGNFFCGWACPYGTAQELFGMIGSLFMKKKLKMPKAVQNYLKYLRYIIMVVSTVGLAALFFETMNSYLAFLTLFDVAAITDIAVSVSLIIMVSLLIISMFFERPYCNYLCSEGVKYGVFSFARIFSIKRNEATCVSCKKCDQACPMNIKVSETAQVRNAQCINCLECVSACPVNDTLTYAKVGWNLKNKNANEAEDVEIN